MKSHSKSFWIKLISGITLCVIAVVTTLSVMIPSYTSYKEYYDAAMAEKKEKERLNALPLEFLGISAELDKNVKYYDNDTAGSQCADFFLKRKFYRKRQRFF